MTKILSPYRISWPLNTTVTADLKSEAELTLFLRMRTKAIAKSLGKCITIEELLHIMRNRHRRSEWQGQIFDRKLPNSHFRACAVKICQNALVML